MQILSVETLMPIAQSRADSVQFDRHTELLQKNEAGILPRRTPASSMTIPNSLRQQVIEDAHYRCAYCKAPSLITGTRLNMDHIFPLSLDGSDDR